MRARDRDLPSDAGAEHALAAGLVGTGDALLAVPASLPEALDAASAEHGEKAARMLQRFAEVPDGTFAWTQTQPGRFHLGRIAGPWRYDDGPGARATGIHHVRDTRWLPEPFGPDEVPVAVAETFARGGRNLQRIRSARAEAESARAWNDRPGGKGRT